MSRPSCILFAAAITVLSLVLPGGVRAEVTNPDNEAAWASIRKDTFGQQDMIDGKGFLSLEAPERAEDAAVVPITIRLTPELADSVKSLTLIVDENPAPIVATFTYGEAAGSGQRTMATRIRVDRYTFVRAVAETADGKFYMTKTFVKASGGCSAPASRDAEEAAKSIGKMRIKTAATSGKSDLGEVMLRHPNISGLAIDQLSGGYPPARFISHLTVTTGGKLVFSMEGGISISEDPHFRFSYAATTTNDSLEVTAEDSDGTKFSGRSGNPS